jgi:hypothetical protein
MYQCFHCFKEVKKGKPNTLIVHISKSEYGIFYSEADQVKALKLIGVGIKFLWEKCEQDDRLILNTQEEILPLEEGKVLVLPLCKKCYNKFIKAKTLRPFVKLINLAILVSADKSYRLDRLES